MKNLLSNPFCLAWRDATSQYFCCTSYFVDFDDLFCLDRTSHTSTDMPPQIKQDLNRSGWESTDFPSVCERCLPDNPYVKMLKEDYAAECKLVCLPLCFFCRSRC